MTNKTKVNPTCVCGHPTNLHRASGDCTQNDVYQIGRCYCPCVQFIDAEPPAMTIRQAPTEMGMFAQFREEIGNLQSQIETLKAAKEIRDAQHRVEVRDWSRLVDELKNRASGIFPSRQDQNRD